MVISPASAPREADVQVNVSFRQYSLSDSDPKRSFIAHSPTVHSCNETGHLKNPRQGISTVGERGTITSAAGLLFQNEI